MEDSDGIRDNEVAETQGESEVSEQDVGAFPKQHKKATHVEGTKEIEAREKKKKDIARIEKMEKAIRGFRIMSAGDGILRGGFGKLPKNVNSSPEERMASIELSMLQFHLTGDNLNVSGNFNDGYTVTRENPCDQQQVNQNPQ